jgi:hypothetical protein
MSKRLYTEQEIRRFFNEIYFLSSSVEDSINELTPIELPSDEEIKEKSHDYFRKGQLGFEPASDTERAFLRGVLWMRYKIQGGNNEQ